MEQPAGTRNWFRNVEREFARYFAPLCGQAICYVEIGCWLGGSAEWACKNMLTNPGSVGYGIDPYLAMTEKHPQSQMDAVKQFAAERLAAYQNWRWLYGTSAQRLAEWNRGTINALYVDGDHDATAIIQDFRLALPHLAYDAIVVFDDFKIGMRKSAKTTPTACEVIMAVCGSFVRKIGQGRQFAIRLTGSPPERLEWPSELPAWKPEQVRSGPRLAWSQLTKAQIREGRMQRRARWAREAARSS